MEHLEASPEIPESILESPKASKWQLSTEKSSLVYSRLDLSERVKSRRDSTSPENFQRLSEYAQVAEHPRSDRFIACSGIKSDILQNLSQPDLSNRAFDSTTASTTSADTIADDSWSGINVGAGIALELGYFRREKLGLIGSESNEINASHSKHSSGSCQRARQDFLSWKERRSSVSSILEKI